MRNSTRKISAIYFEVNKDARGSNFGTPPPTTITRYIRPRPVVVVSWSKLRPSSRPALVSIKRGQPKHLPSNSTKVCLRTALGFNYPAIITSSNLERFGPTIFKYFFGRGFLIKTST